MEKPISFLYTRYGEALRYLIVGGITTGINVVSFFILMHIGMAWFGANLIAWAVSVAFAFVANKLAVFHSNTKDVWGVIKEAAGFTALRGASLGADTVILFIGLTLLHGNTLVVKLIDQIIVIALNYLFSKKLFTAGGEAA